MISIVILYLFNHLNGFLENQLIYLFRCENTSKHITALHTAQIIFMPRCDMLWLFGVCECEERVCEVFRFCDIAARHICANLAWSTVFLGLGMSQSRFCYSLLEVWWSVPLFWIRCEKPIFILCCLMRHNNYLFTTFTNIYFHHPYTATLALWITFPSASQPLSSTSATIPTKSGLFAYFYWEMSMVFLLNLLPSSISIFLILNFSSVEKNPLEVRLYPSIKSI